MNKKTKIGLSILGLVFGVSAVLSGCAPKVTKTSSSALPPAKKPAVAIQQPTQPVITQKVSPYLRKYPWLASYNIASNGNNIHFAFNKSILTPLDKMILKKDAIYLKWKMGGFVSLTGGEPFLSPSSLFYVAELIEKSPNFQNIAILSNGTLIDENIIKEIKRFKKITEIQISIDGPDAQIHESVRGKGTFLKTVETVKKLVSAGLKTSIMFTVHKKNMDYAEDMLYLAKELKVNALTVERMTTMNEKEKNEFFISPYDLERIYKNLYEKSKAVFAESATKLITSRPLWNLVDENVGGFCPVGLSSVCILHDGTVLPCRRLYLPLGNIIEEGFFKIWYGSKILWSIRNKKNISDNSSARPQSACSDINCSHFKRCGGCKAISYYYHGNIHEKDPQCWLN